MNKNIAFVVFGVLVLASIAGVIILQIHRPDATATFTSFVVQMLGLVVVAGGLGAGLNSIQTKVDNVQKQTNGMNTALRDENNRLTNLLIEKGISPEENREHDNR